MLSAINSLFSTLFGDIFIAWLSCDAILYLLSLCVVAILINMLITLLRP